MKADDQTRIYKAVPLFKSLTRTELDEIVAISRLVRAGDGVVVLEEGRAGPGMYVIVAGTASIRMGLYQGDDTQLASLGKGDVFGEMSLIDDGPVSATVTMTSDGVLFHIEKERFDELRRALRPAAFKVLRALAPTLCDRLRAINARIGDVFSEPQAHMKLMQRRYQELGTGLKPGTSGDRR